ncbi:hypothetical protein BDV06DRAFT_224422 [Aspergillus oleicola]
MFPYGDTAPSRTLLGEPPASQPSSHLAGSHPIKTLTYTPSKNCPALEDEDPPYACLVVVVVVVVAATAAAIIVKAANLVATRFNCAILAIELGPWRLSYSVV